MSGISRQLLPRLLGIDMALSCATLHQCRKRIIDSAIHETIQSFRSASAAYTFTMLVQVVRSRSSLLKPTALLGPNGYQRLLIHLRVLKNLVEERSRWIAPVYEWHPDNDSSSAELTSLIDHLFARHSVPNFVYRVWFLEDSANTTRDRAIFLHLARGHNIRGLDLGFSLTKSMAKHFLTAPDHYSIDRALVWAKSHSRYCPRNFQAAMSRRRKKLVVGAPPYVHDESWERLPINDFRWIEPKTTEWNYRAWTIRQLLSRDELVAEGKRMQHCVAIYAPICAAGVSSIWSLASSGLTTSTPMLTIEIIPRSKEIVQVRGLRNRRANASEIELIDRWARSESLTICDWVF